MFWPCEMYVCFFRAQSLAHLLCEMRDVNKALQFEVDDLKQKLIDAQGDIKVSDLYAFKYVSKLNGLLQPFG